MKPNNTIKALSPIFASLVILAIVTVLFIPVFIWTMGVTAQTQSFWWTSSQITVERIVIEEVNLRSGNLECTIYVRNIGKTATIIDDIFITSSNGSQHVYTATEFGTTPHSVAQGDLITVTISDLGFTPQKGETYSVRVYTTRGVGDTYQVVA